MKVTKKNIQLKNSYNPLYKVHIELSYTDCGLADALIDIIHDTIKENKGDGWESEEEIDITY